MKPGKVRALAICVFYKNGQILVHEGYDSVKNQTFYRPLGGRIEFGERGEETVCRELREEVNAAVKSTRYLGTLENIFTYEGEKGHEIILVYDGLFVDPQMYDQPEITVVEDESKTGRAVWKPLKSFEQADNITPLYPTGLLELLRETL